MKTLIVWTAAALLLAGPALADCNYDPDPFANCMESAGDWLQQNTGNWSNSYDDVVERVQSAGDVIQNCQQCAYDAIDSSWGSSSSDDSQSGYSDQSSDDGW